MFGHSFRRRDVVREEQIHVATPRLRGLAFAMACHNVHRAAGIQKKNHRSAETSVNRCVVRNSTSPSVPRALLGHGPIPPRSLLPMVYATDIRIAYHALPARDRESESNVALPPPDPPRTGRAFCNARFRLPMLHPSLHASARGSKPLERSRLTARADGRLDAWGWRGVSVRGAHRRGYPPVLPQESNIVAPTVLQPGSLPLICGGPALCSALQTKRPQTWERKSVVFLRNRRSMRHRHAPPPEHRGCVCGVSLRVGREHVVLRP